MQYELRYQVIEPKRHTYQNVIDRLGDQPASRYLEGTLDVQPRENFHYLHAKVSAPGYQLITTQLYFRGGEHVGSDIASAVKPELLLNPTSGADGNEAAYDFVLDPV